MSEWQCTVEDITPLTATVTRVRLKPHGAFSFVPGQYLLLKLSEQDRRPFSIASRPADGFIELHIGAAEQDVWARGSLDHLKTHSQVTIEAPGGEAILQAQRDQPVILLAGGSGYSYARCLLLGLIDQQHQGPVHLYWGVRDRAQLYEQDWLQQLAADYEWLTYTPVVQHPDAGAHQPAPQERSGLVHEAILQDFPSLADYQIYAAGRFEMVAIAREAFIAQGLIKGNMYADAFAFM